MATYSFPIDAHLARTRLEAEGIEDVVLTDEYLASMQWLYCHALGGIKLQVPSRFAAEAKQILAVADSGSERLLSGDEVRCSQCGSMETEYFPCGKRWALASFAILGFPFYPVEDGVKCRSCGATYKVAR